MLHGVPPTTLKDRFSGRVAHGTKPGLVKYRIDEEEDAVSDHLIKLPKLVVERLEGRLR